MNYAEYVRREAEKYAKEEHGEEDAFIPDRIYARLGFEAGAKAVERIKWLEGFIAGVCHIGDSTGPGFIAAKKELDLLMGGGKDG